MMDHVLSQIIEIMKIGKTITKYQRTHSVYRHRTEFPVMIKHFRCQIILLHFLIYFVCMCVVLPKVMAFYFIFICLITQRLSWCMIHRESKFNLIVSNTREQIVLKHLLKQSITLPLTQYTILMRFYIYNLCSHPYFSIASLVIIEYYTSSPAPCFTFDTFNTRETYIDTFKLSFKQQEVLWN